MDTFDAPPTDAHIALVTIDVVIEHADSLKAKRRVVKSIKDRLRARFNASVAEIGYQEEWQRALIGITMISNDRRLLERNYAAMERVAIEIKDCEIADMELIWL
jgi:uncharacterized protein YlxP (DUF503 family)